MAEMKSSSSWKSVLLRHEVILVVLLVGEVLYFNAAGRRFGTADNVFNLVRHSVEIGLLALVMTPIILTGGIGLFLGTGHVARLPTQAWVLLAVAVGVWLLVHQTTFGRSFRAIGFAPEGARYAGIPVEKRLVLAYVLAGVVAALASLTYTARFGTA